MPNWLGPLLALVLLVGILGFAFRQGMKTKSNNDDSEPWTGGEGAHHSSDGHS
jgi:hypothetical protein